MTWRERANKNKEYTPLKKLLSITIFSLLLSGCGETIRNAATGITDPTERGLMYLATAIVIHAFMTLFSGGNK